MSHHRIMIETSLNWEHTPVWVEAVGRRFELPIIGLSAIFDPQLTQAEHVVAAQFGYRPGTVTMDPIHRQTGGYILLNWVDFFQKRRDIRMVDMVDLLFTREFREAYNPPEGRGRPEPAQPDPFGEKMWKRIRLLAGSVPIIELPIEATAEQIGDIMAPHLR